MDFKTMVELALRPLLRHIRLELFNDVTYIYIHLFFIILTTNIIG
jgi:hypothetical protein